MILKTKHKFYLITHSKNKIKFEDMTCPHRGGPLTHGEISEDILICPWHKKKKRRCKIELYSMPYIINKKEIMIFVSEFERIIKYPM